MVDANTRLMQAEDKARKIRNDAFNGDTIYELADAVVQGLQAAREILDRRL